VINVNIPYVLDYKTEVSIYKNKFGENIEKKFLPRVLNNFAKLIIATRMESSSPVMQKWIPDISPYKTFCDNNLFLLKMELYTGMIPPWLSDEDIKKFDKKLRKEVLEASETEGKKGFSGRQSINVFSDFLSRYNGSGKPITMDKILNFFNQKDKYAEMQYIPEDFLKSIENLYDFNVVEELKESIYYFNQEQISKDILNYLFAINFEPSRKEICPYTGENIEITETFFKEFEALFTGATASDLVRLNFRKDVLKTYITKTLSQEITNEAKDIRDTEQFHELYKKYISRLKENALLPYRSNDNFRRCIKDFGTKEFSTYDKKLKTAVEFMINNLTTKFGYDKEAAMQLSLYAIDKQLI